MPDPRTRKSCCCRICLLIADERVRAQICSLHRRRVIVIWTMVRFLAAVLLLGALPSFARPPPHMWTDKDGVLHVDDTPPPRRAAPRKPADHWWDKRSDAPPDEIDRAAAFYKIPAELVRAVIWAASPGSDGFPHRGRRHLRGRRLRPRREPGVRSRADGGRRIPPAGESGRGADRAGESASLQAPQPAGAQSARALALQAGGADARGGDLSRAHRGPSRRSDTARESRPRFPQGQRLRRSAALLRDRARSRARSPEGAELSGAGSGAEGRAGTRARVVSQSRQRSDGRADAPGGAELARPRSREGGRRRSGQGHAFHA